MDSSFTIKPPVGVRKNYTPRPPVTMRKAVETELDAARTVTAAGDGDPGQHNRRHDHMPQDVAVDPESREVINRENDIRAHANEREHSDQALLRQRAYRVAPIEAETCPALEPHANIKA